jgi:GNAT superfamily N-acetyltransferase
MNQVGMRPATGRDASAMTALMKAAYGIYVPRLGGSIPPLTADYDEELQTHDVWVIEERGALCGALILSPRADHMLLVNVAVDPASQGRGLGRRLIEKAEDETRKQGYTELHLFTHAGMSENIALYTRLGWHEYERRADSGVPRVFMRKFLT